jgi:hypothetical protein
VTSHLLLLSNVNAASNQIVGGGRSLGYGLDDLGSIPGRDWEFLSSPPLCLNHLWGLRSLLFSGYRGFLPQGYSGQDVKL